MFDYEEEDELTCADCDNYREGKRGIGICCRDGRDFDEVVFVWDDDSACKDFV